MHLAGRLVLVEEQTFGSLVLVSKHFLFCSCRYLRDGLATAKCDVYAFGVVLFELISGKEAITKTDGISAGSNSERRSLASVVSSLTCTQAFIESTACRFGRFTWYFVDSFLHF